jgi:hypothetical protein
MLLHISGIASRILIGGFSYRCSKCNKFRGLRDIDNEYMPASTARTQQVKCMTGCTLELHRQTSLIYKSVKQFRIANSIGVKSGMSQPKPIL